jgi:diguanylate cyclase (GGDEF)-like protein
MDISTLFLTIVLVSATLALTVGWVAEPAQTDGMLLWAVGLVTQTLAYGLLSLRGAAPDWATVVLANGLLAAALALFGESICQFHARRPHRPWLWLPVPVTLLVFAVLIDVSPARLLAGPLIFGVQVLTLLVLLVQARRVTVGRGKTLVIIGMASLLLVLVFRAATCCAGATPQPPLPVASPFSALTFMVVLADTLLTTFGFVLMNKERTDHHNRQLAMFDELTGLPNRRHAMQVLMRQVAIAHRSRQALTVLVLDIDYFKRVNDQHGHMVGDATLRHVANTLAGRLRSQDLLGRVGGEEFLGILPNTDASTSGLHLAETLRAAVAGTPWATAGTPAVALTVSVGVAAVPIGTRCTAEAVCIAADRAMYRAKEAGRNRVELAQAQDYMATPGTQVDPS